MDKSRRSSIEIKISYDAKEDKYTFDSKLKAIFNKAKNAFQIKLPSGKFLLVKPEQLKNHNINDIVGVSEGENIKLIEPKRSPARVSTSK